jgi:putative transposase
MTRTYQIDERKAIAKFRSHLITDHGSIQLVLPLAELAQRLRNGVDHMLLQTELELLLLIMNDEVSYLTGERYRRHRWGRAPGSVIAHGQKLPISRPRVRGGEREVKLGSYELFRQDEDMRRRVWERVMRGLSMRSYDPAVRECAPAFALGKSAVSQRFVLASSERVAQLGKRDLSKLRLCALLLDGVEYRGEHFLVALGIDETGSKTILGFHQGASENQQICDSLLDNLASRGLVFQQKWMVVIDGSRALRASVGKHCGEQVLVQR